MWVWRWRGEGRINFASPVENPLVQSGRFCSVSVIIESQCVLQLFNPFERQIRFETPRSSSHADLLSRKNRDENTSNKTIRLQQLEGTDIGGRSTRLAGANRDTFGICIAIQLI